MVSQESSLARDITSQYQCAKDQSAPFVGVLFIDAGGLGAGSYDTSSYFLTLDSPAGAGSYDTPSYFLTLDSPAGMGSYM